MREVVRTPTDLKGRGMAAEKKPRGTKKAAAETTKKTAATKTTTAKKATATAAKPKLVRARKPKAPVVSAEQIAERAYYIWVEGSEGDAFEHWVRAERELTAA